MSKRKLMPYPTIGDIQEDLKDEGIGTFAIGHYRLTSGRTLVYLDRIRECKYFDRIRRCEHSEITNNIRIAGYEFPRNNLLGFFTSKQIEIIPMEEREKVKLEFMEALRDKKSRKIEFWGFW